MRRRRVTKGKLKKADQKFLLVFERKECLLDLSSCLSILASQFKATFNFLASFPALYTDSLFCFTGEERIAIPSSIPLHQTLSCVILSFFLDWFDVFFSQREEEGNTRLLCSVSRVSWCCCSSFHYCFRLLKRSLEEEGDSRPRGLNSASSETGWEIATRQLQRERG